MNFKDSDRVDSVINTMKTAEEQRSPNRALLNSFYNGDTPWTKQEADENKIFCNFNDKQGTNLLHVARGQLENAGLKLENYFTVTLPDAPAEHQTEWGATITRHINKIIKASSSYTHMMESVFAGIVLHGVGARIWWDDCWRPSFVGIQDLLIPTDTELEMEDSLQYYAVRRKMRPGSLFKKTFGRGKNIDPGWKMGAVRKILDSYKDINQNPHNYDWSNNPEQMTELYKQNLSYYDGDSAPVIWMWDFYYRDEENTDVNRNGWYHKLMLDYDSVPGALEDGKDKRLVYDSRRPVADKLGEIIHFQFGDGNNVPPFMYHSIRSLGWLMFDLVWMMNRLRCQFTQHVFEQMLMLFMVGDPADRSRLEKILLFDKGIIPEGSRIVPASERYQVDGQLVNSLMAGFKQQIGEFTSAYTQNLDAGTQKERTKFEVEAILSQISSLMSSILNRYYRQEQYAFNELCRRFTRNNSPDFDVKKFQQKCQVDGVPERWLNSDSWNIQVDQVLGGGNKMLELAQARELRAMRPELDPNAAQEVDRIYITALTNSKLANRLVPNVEGKTTPAMHDAAQSFGTLMMGVDMEPLEGVNHIEIIETLLRMIAQKVQQIGMSGGGGKPEDVTGLASVAKYIAKHIAILAKDENNKARVKAYADALGKIMNEVRAFAQRQAEAQQKQQPQISPETMAKVKGMMLMDSVKAKSKEAQTAQRLRHKELGFRQQQGQKVAQTMADININTGKALAEVHTQGVRNGANQNPFKE